MRLVPFKFKHYPMLVEMLSDQKCPWIQYVDYKSLPRTGYLTMQGNIPVAAGFLRRVEGGYGQFDTFATNPFFGSKLRHEGIEMIVGILMDEAKRLGMTGIMAFSYDTGIIDRALSKGFKEVQNYKILGIKI